MRIDSDPGLEYDRTRVASACAAACGAGFSAVNPSKHASAHIKPERLTFVTIRLDRLVEVRSQRVDRRLFSGFFRSILCTEQPLLTSPFFHPSFPPTARTDNEDVKYVKGDGHASLPTSDLPVPQNRQEHRDSTHEEYNVA